MFVVKLPVKTVLVLLYLESFLIYASVLEKIVSVDDVDSYGERVERSAANELVYDPNCDEKYKNISANHSMCLVDVGIAVTLSQQVKDDVLDAHNNFRKDVNPTASNMQKMVWDDELALIATKWAQQCRSGHDSGTARTALSLPSIYNGQNMAAGYGTFVVAVNAWHSEVNYFQHGNGSTTGDAVGHYTQVVQHKSSRVGCGQANCTNTPYYMCNYAIGQGSVSTPYDKGVSCSACNDSCTDKLCDCNGTLCYNSGTLDINTCTCSCKSVYTGDQCETVSCTNSEKSWCSQYNSTGCSKYSNFHYDCNMMCGVCPYPCNGTKCENGGTLNIDSCTCSCVTPYVGDTCTDKNCTGVEKYWCKQYSAADCSKYSNFPSDCSIMCGICPAPCNGTTCENGGTLNINACTCSCATPYVGDTCADKNCPGSEKWWCQKYYTFDHCSKYSNFPSDCNIMCKICPEV